jgi:hypothetical protein
MGNPQGRLASIRRLRTRAQQAAEKKREDLRQLLLDLEPTGGEEADQVAEARDVLIAALDLATADDGDWSFVQMGPSNNRAVVKWLRRNSSRPLVAVELWATLFTHLRWDTLEIIATRAQLAEEIEASPGDVSRVMGELESINAVRRERHGRGVRYSLNPHCGTRLPVSKGTPAREEFGALTVVDGGAPAT